MLKAKKYKVSFGSMPAVTVEGVYFTVTEGVNAMSFLDRDRNLLAYFAVPIQVMLVPEVE